MCQTRHRARLYGAAHLERNSDVGYEALDFSDVFMQVARETIDDLCHRVTFTNADLITKEWPAKLSKQPDAIIST